MIAANISITENKNSSVVDMWYTIQLLVVFYRLCTEEMRKHGKTSNT